MFSFIQSRSRSFFSRSQKRFHISCAILALFGGLAVFSHETFAQIRRAPVVLFDGTSADGWGKANGKLHPGWVVEDGALHRKSGGGDLYHESTFRDFELYFEWKISKGGNSGVKYRVKQFGKRWLGCEYQILDDQNNKKEGHKTAGLYDVYSPSPNKPIVQPNVWQVSKIVVCGNRIEHWLNGVMVVQAHVGGLEWQRRVAESKFKPHQGFGENREGRIFLQDHGNPVWFRRIVVVPLDCGPDHPNPVQWVSNEPILHDHGTPAVACENQSRWEPKLRPALPRRCWPVRRTLFLRRR